VPSLIPVTEIPKDDMRRLGDVADIVVEAAISRALPGPQEFEPRAFFRLRGKRADGLEFVFDPPAAVERIIDKIENAPALCAACLVLGHAGLKSGCTVQASHELARLR
jgi:hypothetical protein